MQDKNIIQRRPRSKRGDFEYKLQRDFDKWVGLSSFQTTKTNPIVIISDYKRKDGLLSSETTKLLSSETTTKERKKG